jgi:hypothetical protein
MGQSTSHFACFATAQVRFLDQYEEEMRIGRKQKKLKSAVTSKNIVAQLEQLRVAFKSSLKKHRAHLHELIGHVARIISRLHGNDELRRRVTNLIREKRKKERGAERRSGIENFNLSTEVMALATGATSRGARQAAWKRGRVLDYLLDSGVQPDQVAKAIKEGGGIEKILAKASKEAPRAAPKGKSNSPKPTRKEISGAAPMKRNDSEISFPILISLSDRDSILESGEGAAVTISARRIGRGPNVKVERVEIEEEETSDDWD